MKKISQYLTISEDDAVEELLHALQWNKKMSDDTAEYAQDLIKRIRKTRRKPGSLESFFQEYGLNTKEGLSLMSMAEALLRIPDAQTANALIKDKIAGTNWLKNANSADKNWLTKAAGLGLKLSSSSMNGIFSKLGEPVVREAMGKAMKILGKQFVVGEDLQAAAKNAQKWKEKNFLFSYDMLGEGARTAGQAEEYFTAYKNAILEIIEENKKDKKHKSGISIKLSALHPRYEESQKEKSVPIITEKLLELCHLAAKNDVQLTVDAEETARIFMSLEIIENICADSVLKNWNKFGLAIQAYQKNAPVVIDHIIALANKYDVKLQVRLVKGAYWDTEIKHAQIEGLNNYSVYTRKSNTDVSYLRCAQKLLRNRDVLYPMFGTHNAHTVAAIIKIAENNVDGYSFQKLYGMGDALYNKVIADYKLAVTVYAPVGPYNELLPYLVRRMLENGANSSFVNQLYDKEYKPEDIAFDPVARVHSNRSKHHPNIPLPENIYGELRKNSSGIDFDNPYEMHSVYQAIEGKYIHKKYKAYSIVQGKNVKSDFEQIVINPSLSNDNVGKVFFASNDVIEGVVDTSKIGHKTWSQFTTNDRAHILEKIAGLLEENKNELMSLCVREGGRTLKDALDEVREAVDFCRYYAVHGRRDFLEAGRSLKSPTGETNIYKLESKGIFVCISPWNFPIAIFTGQIVAALMAGNAVIAKPAEQTNLTAYFISKLFLKAGVPAEAYSLLLGDGEFGASLIEQADVQGVTFTGSTNAAKSINRTLANKEGPITKLIAETGGQNAFIVDSSALTEQVIDDVVKSAFGSAGQRCSAARVLFVQEDVYDKTVIMLQGAMQELQIEDPMNVSTDIGPLIDEEAYQNITHHVTGLAGYGEKIAQTPLDASLSKIGHYIAPVAYKIEDISLLKEEIFGPVLHVISYKAENIRDLISEINELKYGLTFAVHSRIESFIKLLTDNIDCGNIYVNRGTTGAVVGVQPFGGRGLSGTGPKAGGPQYLHAFANEKLISTDTTAAGGNASLVMLDE